MKKLVCVLTISIASLTGAEVNGVLDVAKITTPSAPGTSFSRISVNSTTGTLGCLNDDSTNCFNVNASGAASPTLPATTGFYIVGAAASNSRELNIAYAGVAFQTGARFDGTPASPTAVQSGEQLVGYDAFAYDGTTLAGSLATFRIFANQNFTGSAHGTYADIATTPNGTTTLTQVIQFGADGGITVPSTVTGGSKGVGTINAGGLYVNGVAVSTTAGTVTSVATNNGLTGGTITSTGTIGLASVSANTVLGALTATTPSGLALPSCSAAGSALNWTSGTGFGCATGLLSGLTVNSTTISGGATNAILYGDGTVLQNDTGTTRTGAGQQTHTQNALAVTPADALILVNTTAAAAGAQQISPSIHWSGRGWETSTTASQSVDCRSYILPVQGAANPTGQLNTDCSINGGAYATEMFLTTGGNLQITGTQYQMNGSSSNRLQYGTNQIGLVYGSSFIADFGSTTAQGSQIGPGNVTTGFTLLVFDNTASTGSTQLACKDGAGQSTTACLQALSSGGTANVKIFGSGKVQASSLMSTGTTFTTSAGCSESSLSGGATAGKFTSGTTGTCTTTITMGNSQSAPAGWACAVNNQTTGNLMRVTASNASTVTVSGVTATNDVINFACVGY